MKRHFVFLLLAACAAVVGVAALALHNGSGRSATPLRVTLAVPAQQAAGAVQVAMAHGMFERQGVSLDTLSFRTGKQALDTVLAGRADLAVVGDTPFVLALLRGEDLRVVSTVFSSRKSMALLGWRTRGVLGGSHLAGKTVGTVRGTNAQYFLDSLLVTYGLNRDSVTMVELAADQLNNALRSGRVDAVTLWQPELARMQAELGSAGTTVYGDDIFVFRFVLVGRREFVEHHRAAVERVVAALADATDYIHEQPASAARTVGEAVGVDPATLAVAFDVSDYSMTLDQSLLLSLSAQTRWAFRNGLVRDGLPIPDYLEILDQAPLRAVRPEAIRVIQ